MPSAKCQMHKYQTPNAMPNAKCQMPNAKCQMPTAKCTNTKRQMPNAKCQMPNAKCQMPNVKCTNAKCTNTEHQTPNTNSSPHRHRCAPPHVWAWLTSIPGRPRIVMSIWTTANGPQISGTFAGALALSRASNAQKIGPTPNEC